MFSYSKLHLHLYTTNMILVSNYSNSWTVSHVKDWNGRSSLVLKRFRINVQVSNSNLKRLCIACTICYLLFVAISISTRNWWKCNWLSTYHYTSVYIYIIRWGLLPQGWAILLQYRSSSMILWMFYFQITRIGPLYVCYKVIYNMILRTLLFRSKSIKTSYNSFG